MKKKERPTYDLDEIKRLLIDEESRHVTQTARLEAVRLRYADDDEMVQRCLQLTMRNFQKTMPSDKCPGLMQDVYFTYDGFRKIYIKFQISNGKGIIISFKET
jgi:hypothetical protein